MKRFMPIVLAMVFVASLAFAQTWYPSNQKTIGWDAVTQLDDGSPIPVGDPVRYQIYTAISTDTTKVNKINVGNSTITSFVVTFTAEGKYFIGIEAERLDAAGTVVSKSSISWSDNPVVCSSEGTFGIVYFKALKGAGGLKPL